MRAPAARPAPQADPLASTVVIYGDSVRSCIAPLPGSGQSPWLGMIMRASAGWRLEAGTKCLMVSVEGALKLGRKRQELQ